MVSEYIRNAPSSTEFDFHVSLPEGPNGFKEGLVYRFSIMMIAAIFSFTLCVAWGIFNSWQVTRPMIIAIGMSFGVFVLVGEYIRISIFDQSGALKLDYVDIDDISAGHHIAESLKNDQHAIYNERLWYSSLYFHDRMGLSPYYNYGKRALDIVLSVALLILGLPIFLIIMVLLAAENRGRVFEKAEGYGGGGDLIRFLRFSTSERKKRGDEVSSYWRQRSFRSPLRALLVRTGLQRAPELISVIKGDLSLVGPEIRYFDAGEDLIPAGVRPGMTGLAQLSGYKWGESNRVRFIDRYYLLNMSLRLDLVILIKSLRASFSAAQ